LESAPGVEDISDASPIIGLEPIAFMKPAYLKLLESGDLEGRVSKAWRHMVNPLVQGLYMDRDLCGENV
jgi:hypothetical protein